MVLVVHLLLGGCGAINKSAILVNLKENEAEIRPDDCGFLAIRADVVTSNDHLLVLLLNNEKNEHYVVPLNPRLYNSISFFVGPFTVAERQLEKETRDYNLLLFQLPRGIYRTEYVLVGYGGQDSARPHRLREETVRIEPRTVNYVGRFEIVSEMVWIVTKVFEINAIEEDEKDIPARLTIPRVGSVEVAVRTWSLDLDK